MKQEITITELRSNIYAIIDEVIRTGKPVSVCRNNQVVTVALQKPKKKKKKIINDLSKIVPLTDCLVEDAEFYRSIDWDSLVEPWKPDENL